MSVTYKAIDPESGIRWCVRIVFFGDNYGLKHCLTYGNKEFDKKMNEPMIEFYDMDSGAAAIMRGSDDKTEAYLAEEYGQFVGRYYWSSLKFEGVLRCKTLTDWSKRGLNLHGGEDRWSVSSAFMVDAMAAVEAELADRAELERREVQHDYA
tara:strand:+ start:280 stop:735 length:456 start_codon:yes stop_codon:yes gene_type:complete